LFAREGLTPLSFHFTLRVLYFTSDVGYAKGADKGGKVIGFGGAVPGEIISTYVEPAYTRRGVGTMLMTHILKKANVKPSGMI